MLYKKIENLNKSILEWQGKVRDKRISIKYVGYIPAPFGPSKTPHVGFVEATDEDIRKEYDSMVERGLKEESDHVWNKKKGRWEIKKR